MIKRNYFLILFLIFIFINLFTLKNISTIIIASCTTWLYNLLPTIFPFYIISDLLINYGFINILKKFLRKPFYKIFKLNENSIFVIIFSMLTGFPSGAKYIKSLIKEDLMSTKEANKVIRFCHFSNPLFIINVIGIKILGNKSLGYLILISHFLSNFIIAFIFRNEQVKTKINQNINQERFGNLLSKSITNTFNALLIILGNLIVFQILTRIIFNYFNLGSYGNAIVNILIEITSGIFMLANTNINLETKALIITSALSFGGICIHSQVCSILSDTDVKYKNYLIGRLLQAVIAPIILILLLLFN